MLQAANKIIIWLRQRVSQTVENDRCCRPGRNSQQLTEKISLAELKRCGLVCYWLAQWNATWNCSYRRQSSVCRGCQRDGSMRSHIWYLQLVILVFLDTLSTLIDWRGHADFFNVSQQVWCQEHKGLPLQALLNTSASGLMLLWQDQILKIRQRNGGGNLAQTLLTSLHFNWRSHWEEWCQSSRGKIIIPGLGYSCFLKSKTTIHFSESSMDMGMSILFFFCSRQIEKGKWQQSNWYCAQVVSLRPHIT